MAVYEDKLD